MTALITIGNEILLGKTVNTNLAWLASQLAKLGKPVAYEVTVADDVDQISSALRYCWQHYDLVITTGGLGPTKDDISKTVIAKFFGLELEFRAEIWQHIESLFARRGKSIPATNKSQAMVPAGFEALQNDLGTAPGLMYRKDGKAFFALPGVPLELQHLYEKHLKAHIAQAFGLNPVIIRNLHTYGISESGLAELLDQISLPPSVNLAWLPQTGRVDLRLYGTVPQDIANAEDAIRAIAGQWIWAEDCENPAQKLVESLDQKHLMISVAESCTGGLVGEMITSVAGSSKVFEGGVISYANSLKEQVLGVDPAVILQHGAVSEQTALQMVQGIRDLCNTEVGVAITGIAGPDGGSEEKPVGLVYFGFAFGEQVWVEKEVFNGNRASIRHKAAEYAIIKTIKALQEI